MYSNFTVLIFPVLKFQCTQFSWYSFYLFSIFLYSILIVLFFHCTLFSLYSFFVVLFFHRTLFSLYSSFIVLFFPYSFFLYSFLCTLISWNPFRRLLKELNISTKSNTSNETCALCKRHEHQGNCEKPKECDEC